MTATNTIEGTPRVGVKIDLPANVVDLSVAPKSWS
jgi:hypothetical protein